jgi:tRNA dimethylallyltransferase
VTIVSEVTTSDVLVLIGPTAVGKTQVAMDLQDRLGGGDRVQLISVDSAMIYRGLDIGSAKPSFAVLQTYPHALINIKDPSEPYSVAEFVKDADVAVKAAHALGQLPILVGGTMLYAKSFIEGLADLPSADAQMRASLAQEFSDRGGPALHAELAAVDPQAAANIEPANSQRLLRAIEVVRLTGRPISALWAENKGQTAAQRLGSNIRTMSLETEDRALIHNRIEARFDEMLAAGLLDEVQGLYDRGDLHVDLPAIRAVGYRQAWLHLQGVLDYDQFRADALTATRRLAKRQITWLRQWSQIERFALPAHPNALAEVVNQMANRLQPTEHR